MLHRGGAVHMKQGLSARQGRWTVLGSTYERPHHELRVAVLGGKQDEECVKQHHLTRHKDSGLPDRPYTLYCQSGPTHCIARQALHIVLSDRHYTLYCQTGPTHCSMVLQVWRPPDIPLLYLCAQG